MDIMEYVVLAGRQQYETAFSALPDAPTVPFVERPQRLHRARLAVAGALHQLGDAVEPAPVRAPRTLCAD